ncbi:YjcZ family sporulation protein [Virgibacillus sp. DJP39]
MGFAGGAGDNGFILLVVLFVLLVVVGNNYPTGQQGIGGY